MVEHTDVLAAEARSFFFLRRRIARAQSVAEVIDAAHELRPTVLALHDARVAPVNVSAVYSVFVDALTRRMLELTLAESGGVGAEFAWLALGSQARREALPSSDMDSAIVWFGASDVDDVKLAVARGDENRGRAARGLRPARRRPTAPLRRIRDSSGRSAPGSAPRAAGSTDPTQEKALVLVSVLVDSRPVWGIHTGTPVADSFRPAPGNPALLRLLARFALSHRPPTGFLRGLVVESSGEHRGRLDLKNGGVLPIVDLARWAGMAAGVTSASTSERLRAAAAAGSLSESPCADAARTHSR